MLNQKKEINDLFDNLGLNETQQNTRILDENKKLISKQNDSNPKKNVEHLAWLRPDILPLYRYAKLDYCDDLTPQKHKAVYKLKLMKDGHLTVFITVAYEVIIYIVKRVDNTLYTLRIKNVDDSHFGKWNKNILSNKIYKDLKELKADRVPVASRELIIIDDIENMNGHVLYYKNGKLSLSRTMENSEPIKAFLMDLLEEVE